MTLQEVQRKLDVQYQVLSTSVNPRKRREAFDELRKLKQQEFLMLREQQQLSDDECKP